MSVSWRGVPGLKAQTCTQFSDGCLVKESPRVAKSDFSGENFSTESPDGDEKASCISELVGEDFLVQFSDTPHPSSPPVPTKWK